MLPVNLCAIGIECATALVCGGVGLLSLWFIRDQYVLLLSMVGVGIAWASILSLLVAAACVALVHEVAEEHVPVGPPLPGRSRNRIVSGPTAHP